MPNSTKSFLLSIVLLVLVAFEANAQQGNSGTPAIKAALVDSIKSLITEMDPAAQVTVKTTPKVAKARLPGTPFSMTGMDLDTSSVPQEYAKVEVTIFTSDGRLPNSVRDLVTQIAKNYSKDVKIDLKRLPSEFLAARRRAKAPPAPVFQAPKAWESTLSDVLKQMKHTLKRTDEFVPNQIFDSFLGASRIAVIIAGSITALGLLLSLLWIYLQKRTINLMETGFRSIVTALEQGGLGSARGPTLEAAPAPLAKNDLSTVPDDSGKEFGALPQEGLLALLSDCYWTAQDRYGAFIWRHIPVVNKLELMRRMPHLAEYGAFISQLPEENLGVEQDPSYLAPLPLWHLDMPTLTDLVRQMPSFLAKLSPLRAAALSLRPTERLALYEAPMANVASIVSLIPKAPSPPRELKRALRLHVKTEDEELEILKMSQPSLAVIEDVASLGWLLRLPPATIASALQMLSARELASAWVGPKAVLDALASHVGEKKLAMTRSHLSMQKPSRSSPAFQTLHRFAIDEFRKILATPVETKDEASPKVDEVLEAEHAA